MAELTSYFRCSTATMTLISRRVFGQGETIERIRIEASGQEVDNPVILADEVPYGVIEAWMGGRLLATFELQTAPNMRDDGYD